MQSMLSYDIILSMIIFIQTAVGSLATIAVPAKKNANLQITLRDYVSSIAQRMDTAILESVCPNVNTVTSAQTRIYA